MYIRLSITTSQDLQETYFEDPLFCTLTELVEHISLEYNDLTSVECWTEALEVKRLIFRSKRPDLTIPSIRKQLQSKFSCFNDEGNIVQRSQEEADRSSFLVFMCVLYMVCSAEEIEGIRRKVAKCILKETCINPLFQSVFHAQREAELNEENNSNPIPVDTTPLDIHSQVLTDIRSAPYGLKAISILPRNLWSCIADIAAFPDFYAIINGPVIEYMQSPEATSQLWEVVRLVSQEKGYVSRKCGRLRFAELIVEICPSAGKAKQIASNMDKYLATEASKSQDLRTIRSRFCSNVICYDKKKE